MPDTIKRGFNRFPDGLSNQPVESVFALLDAPLLTNWAVFQEDFVRPWDVSAGGEFTHTQTNGALTNGGSTGILVQTLGGADNDTSQFQASLSGFNLTVGKKFAFEARCRIGLGASGVLGEEELFIGLATIQTGTNFMAADGLSRAFDAGIGFISFDGSSSINALQGVGDVFSTELNAFTYAGAVWYKFGIYYDGTTATYYVNNNKVASISTNIPTSIISPCLYIKAGEARAKTLETDYIIAAVER